VEHPVISPAADAGAAPWLQTHTKGDLALDDPDLAYQLPRRCRGVFLQACTRTQKKGVRDLKNAGVRAKLRDQNGRVVHVALAARPHAVRREPEATAMTPVEQGAEHRVLVEARNTHEADLRVPADQGAAAAVTDQTMIFDRQVPLSVFQRLPELHEQASTHNRPG
jgi:hypothetical protein